MATISADPDASRINPVTRKPRTQDGVEPETRSSQALALRPGRHPPEPGLGVPLGLPGQAAGARPLDRRAGRSGAVSVFYDITTRKHAEDELTRPAASLSIELALREKTETELRLRDAELTAFAGVAAHDLKAPLRAVSGFTRILQDDLTTALPDGLDGACSHSMDRIVTAAKRMSQLIDDLLLFATARDRTLNRQPVDLQVLVADVVAERTSHETTTVPGEQALTIDVGPLAWVQADPMMCRQLLDNLIGNA